RPQAVACRNPARQTSATSTAWCSPAENHKDELFVPLLLLIPANQGPLRSQLRTTTDYLLSCPRRLLSLYSLCRNPTFRFCRFCDSSFFSTVAATLFLLNASVFSASSTLRPLIRFSTSRAFCGETRINRA